MAIYWLTINEEKYVNKHGVKYWKLNPAKLWELGENDGRIKYPTSECKAQIGDVAIFYQTKIKSVQHLGKVYKTSDEYNGEEYDDTYVYFNITRILKQPIPLREVRRFKELAYCYRHGVLQMKDKQIKAAEALIELIKSGSKKCQVRKTPNRLLRKKGVKFQASKALIRMIKKRM